MPTEPWMWTHVQHMLQALSLPGDAQLRLYPNGCCKGDELALDYDNWSKVLLGHGEAELTHDQQQKLMAIDKYFVSFSGQANANLWSEEAILRDPHWEKVRALAIEALKAFQWDVVPPPREWVDRHMFGTNA